jgi:hypothetical protein
MPDDVHAFTQRHPYKHGPTNEQTSKHTHTHSRSRCSKARGSIHGTNKSSRPKRTRGAKPTSDPVSGVLSHVSGVLSHQKGG